MAEGVFLLSPLITNNFDKKVLNKFLAERRLHSEYVRSGLQHNIFIQNCINEGRIKQQDFADFLFKELLYGNQRRIFMYEIFSINKEVEDQTEIFKIIQKYYPNVDSLYYNEILFQPYDDRVTDLVGIKVVLKANSTKIEKIVLVFSEKCIVNTYQGRRGEYSYITIEMDITKKLLYVKVRPKSRISDEKQKTGALAKKYFDKVRVMFGFTINEYLNIHKNSLCNMNVDLYDQIYKRMVQIQPENIDEFIKSTSEKIKQKLDISNYEIKVAENNIFNIHDTLQKMMEHVLISNILYDSTGDGNLDGVDGFVTYIKFSDGTNISARLRSEEYIEPIFASEAFMALRSSIENTKQISILKIYWLNSFNGLRVSYDATDSQCLEILLYKHHKRREFEYAISKYRECEKYTKQQITGLLPMEA